MDAAKRAVRTVSRLADAVVVALMIVFSAVGFYALWDSRLVGGEASPERWEAWRPTGGETASFEELVAINPEVTAWLTVYGTNIDYPVCQGADLRKYLVTDAAGAYSMSGALFLDPASDPSLADFSTMVYGHHMADGVMFGQVTDFANQAFFDEHRYGDVFAGGRHFGLEFMCYLQTDANDRAVYRREFADADDEQAYVSHLVGISSCRRETAHADRLLCLSTCASAQTNGRGVLVARVTEETYDDPFARPEETGTGVDAAAQLPVVAALAAVALAAWAIGRAGRGTERKEGRRT